MHKAQARRKQRWIGLGKLRLLFASGFRQIVEDQYKERKLCSLDSSPDKRKGIVLDVGFEPIASPCGIPCGNKKFHLAPGAVLAHNWQEDEARICRHVSISKRVVHIIQLGLPLSVWIWIPDCTV